MAKKIGVVIALDGEREFTQAARNAQKEANMFKAELKKLTAEFDGNANSIDFLRKKQENLTKQQEAYSKKVEAANAGLERANINQKRQADRLEELKKELEQAKNAFEDLKKTQDQSSAEYRKQEKEVEKLTKAVEKQTLAQKREEGSVSDWKKQIADAETAQTKINAEIKKNTRLMKEAESATNGLAKSIDGYGNEVQQTVKITETLGQSIKEGFGEAIGGKGFDLLEKGVEIVADTMVDASGASKQLAASTGLSEDAAKRYQKVMQGIKGDNFGESYKDIANVMGEVVQIMGQLDDSAMKETTESAIALRDTFDMDVNETIRAVDVMMKTMGVDAAQAFDLITVGAQNGLNRSGELVDNLTEYSQIWGQAGFSAEEMFAIMENGLDAGAYNLDKINDYVKEFGNSLADGRIEKNIGSFSEGTKTLFESWKQGGASTSDVFYSVIDDLSEMENQQKALTIASEVWSAVGEDNAMQVLTALDDVNDGYKDVKGAADQLKETKYSDLENAIGGLGNALQERFVTPIANVAIPAVTGLAEIATDLIKGPEKSVSKWQEMADGLSQANDEIAVAVQNRDSVVADAEAEASRVGYLGQRLLELNSIEKLSTAQKAETKAIVDQLGQSIPQLAAAYDEESGKINLSKTALEGYITSYKDAIVAQATLAANQDLMNSLVEAQVKFDEAADAIGTLQSEINALDSNLKNVQDLEEMYSNGLIGQEEYQKGLEGILAQHKELAESGDLRINMMGADLSFQIGKKKEELEVLEKEQEEYGKALEEGTEEYNKNEEAARKLIDAQEKNKESTEEAGEAAGGTAEKTDELSGSMEGAKEAADGVGAKTEEELAAAEEAAERAKEAFQSMAESINQSMDNTANAFEGFDGGEEISADELLANLQSATDGVDAWVENMKALGAAGGSGMTQELYDELAQMGPESANLVQMLVETLGSDTEKFGQICEQWTEALKNEDDAAIIASYTGVGNGVTDTVAGEIKEGKDKIDGAIDEVMSGTGQETDASGTGTVVIEQTAAEISANKGIIADAVTGAIDEAYGQAKEKAGTFREVGAEIGHAIAAGMSGAQEEINNAITFNASNAGGDADGFGQAGAAIAQAYAQGISASAELARQAAEGMSTRAVAQLRAKRMDFQDTGTLVAQQYAQGITSSAGQAQSAASAMASRVLASLRAQQNGGYSVGSAISAGVASGISGGASAAIGAAASMASSALAAAKAALGIRSPSRRFRYEVGQNISESTAFGIKDKASLAGKAASKMSAKVYTSATAWMSRYKKAYQTTLEDEKYFWQQVQKHTKAGTSAYKNAQKQIDRIVTQQIGSSELATQIGKNFGVSKTTKSGKKTKKKDTETYYSEIYSAAEKYMKNYQVLHAVSEQQELAYWTQVKSKLKSKTQAWYDATAKIKDLQQEIAENEVKAAEEAVKTKANVQDDLLDKYKVYYKVSAKAEMEYWNIARKQFKAGTDERIEADKKYMDALQEFYDQRKELDEEYKENSQEINDQLIEDIKDLQDAYKDAVESRKDDILSQMNLFEAWDSEGYDADTLLYNLKTQVAGLTLWEQQLEELGKKGVSSALLEELKAMGPDAAASIYSLNQMTAEQLSEYQKLWEQKNALAESQAVKDNEGLRQETNKEIADLRTEAQAELNALNAEYRSALNELNTGLSSDLRNLVNQAGSIGEEAVSGMIAAIGKAATSVETYNSTTQVVSSVSSQLGALTPAGTTIGKSTLDGLLKALTDESKISIAAKKTIQSIKRAMQEEAEIHSPAKLFDREVGGYIPDGVAGGMERETKKSEESARNMVRRTFRTAQEELRRQQSAIGNIPELNYSGIVRLNRLMDQQQTPTPVVNVDTNGITGAMQQILTGMNAIMKRMDQLERLQVVMYPDALIGEIREGLDKANADTAIIRNRGW